MKVGTVLEGSTAQSVLVGGGEERRVGMKIAVEEFGERESAGD